MGRRRSTPWALLLAALFPTCLSTPEPGAAEQISNGFFRVPPAAATR